jgi:hypothetical protein
MALALGGFMLLILTVFSSLAPVMAQQVQKASVSECKGLDQTSCAGKERCSWVKSFKTKKGREVSAFCRKKPERKQAAQAAKPAVAQAQAGVQ